MGLSQDNTAAKAILSGIADGSLHYSTAQLNAFDKAFSLPTGTFSGETTKLTSPTSGAAVTGDVAAFKTVLQSSMSPGDTYLSPDDYATAKSAFVKQYNLPAKDFDSYFSTYIDPSQLSNYVMN
jgi:hypothetical protein